jgi:transcriptional regulator
MKNNDEILRLRSLGLTHKEISVLVGCSESQVWLVLKNVGLTINKTAESSIERLQRRLKENQSSRCWEFQGSCIDGYGQIKLNGKMYRAHRLAYSLFVGEIPDGLVVCHKCDNPPCCNPNHLFLGSRIENIADRVKKGRCAKGSKLPSYKITDEVRLRIYDLRNQGLTQEQIGKEIGTSHATISRVLSKKI